MDSQIWIIAQMVIDILLVALLLWSVKSQHTQQKSHQALETVYEKSERILSEMRLISQSLDKNLEQKKELSRHILSQLDEGLQRAEASYQQLSKIIRQPIRSLEPDPTGFRESSSVRSAVKALLAKGLSKEEIAQHTGLDQGEIELMLKLSSKL